MDGFSIGGHAGFFEGFRQGGVGVACSGQIFRTCSVFNSNDSFGYHFSCSRTHDVGTKQFISFLIGQYFDHSVGVRNSFGSGVGQEGEDAFIELDIYVTKSGTFLFEFLFGVADAGNFGVGVDDTGDGEVVYVGDLSCYFLGCEYALFFSFVGQHGSPHDITDTQDSWDVGFEVIIDNDSSFLVKFDSSFVAVQVVSVGSSASGN